MTQHIHLAVHWQFGILILQIFLQIVCQTWPQNLSRTTGLVLQCRLQQKSAPQTNSRAIPWQFGILSSPPPMTQHIQDVTPFLSSSHIRMLDLCLHGGTENVTKWH